MARQPESDHNQTNNSGCCCYQIQDIPENTGQVLMFKSFLVVIGIFVTVIFLIWPSTWQSILSALWP
jgi:hypothetical protein